MWILTTITIISLTVINHEYSWEKYNSQNYANSSKKETQHKRLLSSVPCFEELLVLNISINIFWQHTAEQVIKIIFNKQGSKFRFSEVPGQQFSVLWWKGIEIQLIIQTMHSLKWVMEMKSRRVKTLNVHISGKNGLPSIYAN